MKPLDRIDAALVVALQNDARRSNKELARHVGLAPSSCLERVRRLREDGVLIGFHAEVDPGSVGANLEAMIVIRMHRHDVSTVETFQEHLLARREVLAMYHLAGANDFLVHVAVRDAEHLRSVSLDVVASHPAVRDLETALIFGRRRSPGGMPVYAVAEDRPAGAAGRRTPGRRG